MLAMLRVAPGGSAPPIPCVARRGEALPGRDGKAGLPIEQESWTCDVAAWTSVSRSGLSVTTGAGVQLHAPAVLKLPERQPLLGPRLLNVRANTTPLDLLLALHPRFGGVGRK